MFRTLMWIIISYFGIATCYSAAAQAQDNPLHIAVGNYNVEGPQQAGILVRQGLTDSWKLISPTAHFPKLYAAGLKEISCTEETCVTIGFYDFDKSSPVQGLILTSLDKGQSWKLSAPFEDMPNFDYASFSSVSCVKNLCVITGDYSTKDSNGEAIIFTSHDRGQSWKSQSPFANLPNFCNSTLSSVKCTNNLCVAIGNLDSKCNSIYYDQIAILTSRDEGNSWEITLPLKSTPAIKYANLFDVSCSNNACIAVGSFNVGKGHQAIIFVSHDNGKSWLLSLPFDDIPHLISSGLGKVSCKDNLCFATGYYEITNSAQQIATILRSIDEGKSWTKTTPLVHVPYLESSDIVSGVDCTDTLCIAVGNYNTNNISQGMILISRDKGESWELISPFAGTPNLEYSYILSANCINNTCVAVSGYFDSNKHTENQASLLTSDDDGRTWHFIDPFLNLPNYWSAGLYGVASTHFT